MEGRVATRKSLQNELTSQHDSSDKQLKVIPIIGMGGIGKSTLAEDLYKDADIRFHFKVWAWATITSTYKEKSIAAGILGSLIKEEGDLETKELSYLAHTLKQKLSGNRYLIVIDDIWSRKAWNAMFQWFPDDNNKSRILLTTRIEKVARYTGTNNVFFKMELMNENQSWDLFKSVAFANEVVEPELEKIGKKIVLKCEGLPLTVVVVAGLLGNSERSIESWENISKDVMDFVRIDRSKPVEEEKKEEEEVEDSKRKRTIVTGEEDEE